MKGMQDRRHWSAQKQDRVEDITGMWPVPAGGGEDAANARTGQQPVDRQAAVIAQSPRAEALRHTGQDVPTVPCQRRQDPPGPLNVLALPARQCEANAGRRLLQLSH